MLRLGVAPRRYSSTRLGAIYWGSGLSQRSTISEECGSKGGRGERYGGLRGCGGGPRQVLVEKEWVGFGHPFASALGHPAPAPPRPAPPPQPVAGRPAGVGRRLAPVLLQWLDCVWQLTQATPPPSSQTPPAPSHPHSSRPIPRAKRGQHPSEPEASARRRSKPAIPPASRRAAPRLRPGLNPPAEGPLPRRRVRSRRSLLPSSSGRSCSWP
jgi:hypothetical protein